MFKKCYLKRITGMVMGSLFGTIVGITTSQNIAALTFDDGPCPQYTPLLLDILDKHKAKATFFLVGKQVRRYQELVKEIIDAGHAIGNHTWDHPSFPLISSLQRRQQIIDCEKALGSYKTRLFRPPYGHQNLFTQIDSMLLGYKTICWNIVAQDWLDDSSEIIAKRVLEHIRPGSIILLHDFLYTSLDSRYVCRNASQEALRIILEKLSGSYQFVTIPELLKLGRPQKQYWCSMEGIDFLAKLKKENQYVYER